MGSRWKVSIKAYAATINSGVDVSKMDLKDMSYSVTKRRKVFNQDGNLTYQLDSGKMAKLKPGDVLYLINGDEVELT